MRSERNYAVDGLRGLLAFGVFIHHSVITYYFNGSGVWQAPPEKFYNEIGQSSVALFFMISAFLFWGKMLDGGERTSFGRLYVGRVFRLYPLYLFVVLVVTLSVFFLDNWRLRETGLAIAQEIGLWLRFSVPFAPNINGFAETGLMIAGVTWTLAYEWLFYLSLPLLGLFFAGTQKRLPAIGSGFLILVFFGFYGWRSSLSLDVFLMFFGGVFAAYWVRTQQLQSLTKSRWASVGAVVCLALCMTLAENPWNLLSMLGLSLFFIVVASGNTFFGLLSLKPIRWLGEISYSTYLLHGLVIWFVLRRFFGEGQSWIYFIASILCASVLVVLSSITFSLIENPGQKLGHRFLSFCRQRVEKAE